MDEKPSALLASDLHLQESTPLCRIDDYNKAQLNKLQFAKNICRQHNIPFIVGGDIFDYWKPSYVFLGSILENVPQFIAIPGQHDLPANNLDLYYKSALSVLEKAGKGMVISNYDNSCFEMDDFVIYGFPYGAKLDKVKIKKHDNKRIVCLIHALVVPYGNSGNMNGTVSSDKIFDVFKMADLILAGDNHQQFVINQNNKLLVNPGSMVRRKSDQIDHKPKFYLWYAKSNIIKSIDIPIEHGVITREHIEDVKEHDDYVNLYVDNMKRERRLRKSFNDNMVDHIANNSDKINERTKQILFLSLEREKI
jgi:DNA repair exonuclease SbcCD nuclease subunit